MMTPDMRLENHLRVCAAGRLRAWSVADLGDLLGTSDRETRRLIEGLVRAGRPIGSHPDHGVFWIVDRADLDLAERALMEPAKRLARRARRLRKNCRRVLGVQDLPGL
jgi:hypothetical protein